MNTMHLENLRHLLSTLDTNLQKLVGSFCTAIGFICTANPIHGHVELSAWNLHYRAQRFKLNRYCRNRLLLLPPDYQVRRRWRNLDIDTLQCHLTRLAQRSEKILVIRLNTQSVSSGFKYYQLFSP